jgi:hypothetical protein
VSRTPAVCAIEQADRSVLVVLKAIYVASASGRGADMTEVRDLLILFHGFSAQEAGQAITDAEACGVISFRETHTA